MPKMYRKKAKTFRKRKFTSKYKTTFAKPREYQDFNTKTMAGLPKKLAVKMPFHSDPKWYPAQPIVVVTPGQPTQSYIFIDLVQMDKFLNVGMAGNRAYWHSTHHQALTHLYQEFRYESTGVYAQFIFDSYHKGNPYTPTVDHPLQTFPMESLHMVCAIVPLAYLRGSGGGQHTSNQAGEMFTNVDYFTMLSSHPGARTYAFARSGAQKVQSFYKKIDAYSHNGQPIIGTARQANNIALTNPKTGDIVSTVEWPTFVNDSEQMVLLIAFRWVPETKDDHFTVRASFRLDQNFVYQDLTPPIQLLSYTGDCDGQ